MRILWRGKALGWRVTFSLGRTQYVHGVNSTLRDGNHILMWDFDAADLQQVQDDLLAQIDLYDLPPVHVILSSPDGGLHAYSMVRRPWLQALSIVAATPGVDPGYVKWSGFRQHFTLRVSEKGGNTPTLLTVLTGRTTPEADPTELESYTRYETWIQKLR